MLIAQLGISTGVGVGNTVVVVVVVSHGKVVEVVVVGDKVVVVVVVDVVPHPQSFLARPSK